MKIEDWWEMFIQAIKENIKKEGIKIGTTKLYVIGTCGECKFGKNPSNRKDSGLIDCQAGLGIRGPLFGCIQFKEKEK